ncbi:hypothetical protein FNV43_RR19535 [Rhamnella rubrinervis]|uniref:Uncharacterized protein n=1 Tax=Rhamnella rubrinervis TaxID=2594499 RepID=A0A8K0GPL1_9ROSA|nr:hypothetical protein FNV43_RR19535 [Rhamnella rubrinervis]
MNSYLIVYTASSKKSAVARASEDFMPKEPTFQTLHIASVAFNSLFRAANMRQLNSMVQQEHWVDVRYVSDKPGNHDFKILKKLVLPDGSILRARISGHVQLGGAVETVELRCRTFRFSLWWMLPSFGESGCEVPAEAQLLVLEISEPTSTAASIAGEAFLSSAIARIGWTFQG